MPKINICLKKQAFKLHLVRSVQLVARPISLTSVFLFVQQVARDGEIPPRCVIDDFVQQVARYGEIPPQCVIDDFVQQVARYGFTLCIHTTTMTHKG